MKRKFPLTTKERNAVKDYIEAIKVKEDKKMIKVKVRTDSTKTFAVIQKWQNGQELSGFQVLKDIDIFTYPDLIAQELIALGYAFVENKEKGTIFLTESKDVCLLWVGLKRGDDYQIKLLKRLADIARENGYFLLYGE